MPFDGTMKSPLTLVLEGARAVLDEDHWFCASRDGKTWKSGYSVCAAVAIERMTEDDEDLRFAAFRALHRVINDNRIEQWNDKKGRTLAEVHAAFDSAIAWSLSY